MASVRQAADFRVNDPVKPLQRTPRVRRRAGKVVQRRIHPLVLAAALELAGGEIRRMDPQEDGSVRILNCSGPGICTVIDCRHAP
jgi:DNA replication initiation complex subunit (GINS family)